MSNILESINDRLRRKAEKQYWESVRKVESEICRIFSWNGRTAAESKLMAIIEAGFKDYADAGIEHFFEKLQLQFYDEVQRSTALVEALIKEANHDN